MNKHTAEKPLTVLGLMSGTSLDGVDLAVCRFWEIEGKWKYELVKAATTPYPDEWKNCLNRLFDASAREIFMTDARLGRYFGDRINAFINENNLRPDLIASHGHTLFHQPADGYTTQIGSGAVIAAVTEIDTVCDFRSKDVALGGQGAPLVPVGDHHLFPEYGACINLGGFANISMDKNGERIAGDICPVNMPLNELATRVGMPYDRNGELARGGRVINELLEKLNSLTFYEKRGARSLGREWYLSSFAPLISDGEVADLSRTVCEHIALKHAEALKDTSENTEILVTGGGALHRFLIERISDLSQRRLVVPDEELINFKEALIFAFLGALYHNKRTNVFSSATGSEKPHIGGALYSGR